MTKLHFYIGIGFSIFIVNAMANTQPSNPPNGQANSQTNKMIRSEKVFLAEHSKNGAYIREGLITGGDRSTEHVEVMNIRRSQNSGFERIVIDLREPQDGSTGKLRISPFYQAALYPASGRLVFSLWGNPRLNFDTKKVLAGFKKSTVVQRVGLLPRLEDSSWTFYLDLKPGSLVELFELSDPVRIIIDLKKKVN